MNNKKVFLLFISLVFMINLAGFVIAQAAPGGTDFSLVEIFETIRGFDVAETYTTFPFLIDTIIYFIFFISIAQVTLGRQFEGPGGRGVVIAVGLALAVAISFWAKGVGFTLGSLGPLAGLIFALVIGIKVYRLLKGNESVGSGIWIAIIVLYIGAFMFFPEIIAALQSSKAGRLGLAVLNVAFIIALPMALISMFRGGGGPPGGGPAPGDQQSILPRGGGDGGRWRNPLNLLRRGDQRQINEESFMIRELDQLNEALTNLADPAIMANNRNFQRNIREVRRLIGDITRRVQHLHREQNLQRTVEQNQLANLNLGINQQQQQELHNLIGQDTNLVTHLVNASIQLVESMENFIQTVEQRQNRQPQQQTVDHHLQQVRQRITLMRNILNALIRLNHAQIRNVQQLIQRLQRPNP